ncbi:HNH endonuclease [Arcicella aquatica]|uniref:HNH endonuclease n=1 Tax=Arcicella aquatica TaxID=217141 RepID=A0ABU5QT62_9BACT|nr:HNH endonuclease [Arcicella aquatica]MEA5260292.1 HNH endonuclease [Arcicella aquatica]
MSNILDYFIHAFTHLRRDNKNGGAPHKPILLIALIHEYELGHIPDHKVYITPELTHSFSLFWNQLVTTPHDPRFALPFFHLTGEKGNWWQLMPNVGCELWIENAGSMRSFGNLSAAVAYAIIDINLATLLLNQESRNLLKQVLLKTYFPNKTLQQDSFEQDTYFDNLKNDIYEPSIAYKSKLEDLKKNLDPETYQIEVYNRGAIFRREVVKIYDATCAISGLRISASFSISMVDACHIIPFAIAFDNTLTNGIALCPNLHRAFDRGLIAINDHYEIILSKSFKENKESDYSFHKLEGKTILLPQQLDYQSSLENFAWHRTNIFKK